ncbi:MAG: hypothetical protein ACRDVE_19550 [Actinocrinis sp.]
MRGEIAKNAKIQPEQRLFGYLSEVADEASGKLAPATRIRLVASLRETIEQERTRRGGDLETLERILARLGEPVTLVDGEVQRDPDYQARLSERLSKAPSIEGPQIPIGDDLAALLAPGKPAGAPYAPLDRSIGTPGGLDGPELCLDPDPFAPEYSMETVGALAAPIVPHGESPMATTATILLPELTDGPEQPVSPVMVGMRSAWLLGPRKHPWEALAIALFLLGAVLGQWVILLIAGLVAVTSRFYSEVEKWTLAVGVPVATALCYAFGFWLHQRGIWGGTNVNTSDLLSGAASFFGTLPRIAALLAALFLGWRLARGITRSQ